MITHYHRPKTLEEALTLFTHAGTVPLGGGTLLSQPTADSVQVADLQLLNLNSLTKTGNDLQLGATLTLQDLLESEHCPEGLKTALKLEAPLNIRNSATIAGTLFASDGRSTFATTLLALDAKIETKELEGNGNKVKSTTTNIGEFLPLRPSKLITSITIPLNTKSAFEYVARTPADTPIVCAALTQWSGGRTRLALGGYGKNPMLAMDGTASDDLATAARNAFHEAGDDFASAEYRMDVASTLAKRCASALA